jgi:hypothetical protein
MADSYEETLEEVAEYFDTEVEALRRMFAEFLALSYKEARELDPYQRAVCYSVYRITKLKSACRMTRRSREGWKNRAMELGSPPHLRKEAPQ